MFAPHETTLLANRWRRDIDHSPYYTRQLRGRAGRLSSASLGQRSRPPRVCVPKLAAQGRIAFAQYHHGASLISVVLRFTMLERIGNLIPIISTCSTIIGSDSA